MSAVDYRIRETIPADEVQWRDLWQRYLEFYESTVDARTTATLWERIGDARHPIHCRVAASKTSAELYGMVQFFPHPTTWSVAPTCYLQDLYVRKALRGNGLGAALIQSVVSAANRHGWNGVYWQTKHDNHRARGLYDRLTGGTNGFVIYELENGT